MGSATRPATGQHEANAGPGRCGRRRLLCGGGRPRQAPEASQQNQRKCTCHITRIIGLAADWPCTVSLRAMSFLLISYAIQASLIVHCIKTGRNQLWIWVLAMLPVASIFAYVAAELVPDLLRSRTTQRTVKGVKNVLNPERDLKRLAQHAQISGGVDVNQRHAEELLRLGRTAEAAEVYRKTLRGLYEHDPNLLLGLARAQFAAGEAGSARATLDVLIKHNPAFRSSDGHLLYARALEQEGQPQRALDEYAVLAGYYPGAEAKVRYAQLLRAQSQPDLARQQLRELLNQAALAPLHYRRSQEEWLKQAERELNAL
jgi:hypothetical protein